MRAMTLQGSYTGSLPELKELIALLGKASLPWMPVEVRPLDSVNASLSDLKDGKVIGRLVLAPN
jgi:D-arabinose 1-dehydrogenase-like Zn-dependent alcohol dehydrogenase